MAGGRPPTRFDCAATTTASTPGPTSTTTSSTPVSTTTSTSAPVASTTTTPASSTTSTTMAGGPTTTSSTTPAPTTTTTPGTTSTTTSSPRTSTTTSPRAPVASTTHGPARHDLDHHPDARHWSRAGPARILRQLHRRRRQRPHRLRGPRLLHAVAGVHDDRDTRTPPPARCDHAAQAQVAAGKGGAR